MSSDFINLYYDGVIFSKKNSKQIIQVHGRPMIVSNSKAKANERDMAKEFAYQVMKNHWVPDGRYSVSMFFTRKDNVRRDLDNLATSVLDALVLAGALKDDNVSCVGEVRSVDMGINRENPGVAVQLEQIKEEPGWQTM